MGIDMDMAKTLVRGHAPAAAGVLASERGAAERSMAWQGKGAPWGSVKRNEEERKEERRREEDAENPGGNPWRRRAMAQLRFHARRM